MPGDVTRSQIAAEACVDGFPMVFDLEQLHRSTTAGMGSPPPAPFDTLAHATALAVPADTLWSDTSWARGGVPGGSFVVPAIERLD